MPKAKVKTAQSESNIHAVVGSDESEVKRVATELAAKLTPADAGEFSVEVEQIYADEDVEVRRAQAARRISTRSIVSMSLWR